MQLFEIRIDALITDKICQDIKLEVNINSLLL